MIGMFFIGLGLGQLMQTLTIASQNAVGPRDIGVATSSSTFFRQIGGTLGVAVLFSVLFSRIPDTIAAAFASRSVQDGIAAATADPAVLADPANKQILGLFQNPGSVGTALDGDTSFLNGSDPRLAAPFLEGFSNATVTIYWVGLGVVLVAFILSFFLKAAPLREKSALQENADADAALLAQEAADSTGALVTPGAAAADSDALDSDATNLAAVNSDATPERPKPTA
ncbi:MAG: MFS transporter, partial [Salinibacterium sp.]|nr:MFS transporter [Salinibacterium sp.]